MKPESCPTDFSGHCHAADRSASFSLAQRLAFLEITGEDRERLRNLRLE